MTRGLIPGLILVTALFSGGLHAQEEKPTVPDEASRKRVLAEIKELFRQDYAKRDIDSRRDLASKLLDQSDQSQSDPVSCFVLLTEATTLATEVGDVETAFRAIRKLEEFFDLSKGGESDSPVEMKLKVLGRAQRTARRPEEAFPIAVGYLEVAREAVSAGDFKAAQDAAKKASALARKIRDKALVAEVGEFSKTLPDLKREHETASKVDLAKAIDIGATRTNLAVGRFLCFVKADWERGLEFLQWSGEKGLAEVAKKDLAQPKDGKAQYEVAEGWLAVAAKERSSLHKKRYQGRAKYWYERANLKVDGLTQIKVTKRLDELRDRSPGGIDLLRMNDVSQDTVKGTWAKSGRVLACQEAVNSARVMIPYQPPEEYRLTLDVERFEGSDCLVTGLVSGPHQFVHQLDGYVGAGHISGFELLDGIAADKNESATRGPVFTNGKTSTVVYTVKKNRIVIQVDGKTKLDWQGAFDRLSVRGDYQIPLKNALFIGAFRSKVRFHRVVLTELGPGGRRLR